MKKLILLTIVCSAFCIAGYAQTKEQSIKQLIHLMQQDSTMEKVMRSTVGAMSSQFPTGNDPAAKAKAMEAMNAGMEVASGIMKKFMDEDMVQIYDKNFSQKEIEDYIAFYKSPSGQKMITSMPAIQKDIMMLMAQKYMPQMMQEMMKKTEEMKKQ